MLVPLRLAPIPRPVEQVRRGIHRLLFPDTHLPCPTGGDPSNRLFQGTASAEGWEASGSTGFAKGRKILLGAYRGPAHQPYRHEGRGMEKQRRMRRKEKCFSAYRINLSEQGGCACALFTLELRLSLRRWHPRSTASAHDSSMGLVYAEVSRPSDSFSRLKIIVLPARLSILKHSPPRLLPLQKPRAAIGNALRQNVNAAKDMV